MTEEERDDLEAESRHLLREMVRLARHTVKAGVPTTTEGCQKYNDRLLILINRRESIIKEVVEDKMRTKEKE